jgi:hypothetical protein
MIVCNICKKEYETARQFHGHLLKTHFDDYKKSGNFDKQFYESEEVKMAEKKKKDLPPDVPEGFRLLKKTDPDEKAAFEAGYRYIDAEENVYKHFEAKEEGWI